MLRTAPSTLLLPLPPWMSIGHQAQSLLHWSISMIMKDSISLQRIPSLRLFPLPTWRPQLLSKLRSWKLEQQTPDWVIIIFLVANTCSYSHPDISVLSFWATTDPATVDKLWVYRRAYKVSVLRIACFVFATATNINGMHVCLQYTYVHRLYCKFGEWLSHKKSEKSRSLQLHANMHSVSFYYLNNISVDTYYYKLCCVKSD